MSKKYLGIVCLLYSGIITYIWYFDKLKNFLAPSMQIYIKISLIPLIVIGLIIIFNNQNNYKFKISDLVLLLPLLIMVLAGDGRLTSSFATNRTININNENRTKTEEKIYEDAIELIPLPSADNSKLNESSNDNKEDNEVNQSIYDFNKPYFEIIDTNYNELSNYLTFDSKASKYEGKTIKVSGFALKNAKYIPDGYFAIGKYAITCCAADASFTGFIAKYDKSKIKDNNWYSIEGILEKGKDSDGYDIMYIYVINIEEIDSKKQEQYVYPCYAYETSMCKDVMKYDLEY